MFVDLSSCFHNISPSAKKLHFYRQLSAEGKNMGFIILAMVAAIFCLALIVSIIIGTIGFIIYRRHGRARISGKQVFRYVFLAIILIGLISINLIPFPQAPPGSNYHEWFNEWGVKAVLYALTPGIAFLLAALASLFCQKAADNSPLVK